MYWSCSFWALAWAQRARRLPRPVPPCCLVRRDRGLNLLVTFGRLDRLRAPCAFSKAVRSLVVAAAIGLEGEVVAQVAGEGVVVEDNLV